MTGAADGRARQKVTLTTLAERKRAGERVSWLTAYDYPTARVMDRAGVELILVGDSLAMTVLGHETTLPVTMEEMLVFTKAVCRAVEHAFVVGDLPFMPTSPRERFLVRSTRTS